MDPNHNETYESPLNFNDYVNDTESLHMFDSPAAGPLLDPTAVLFNTDLAASPYPDFSTPATSSPNFQQPPLETSRKSKAGPSTHHPRTAQSSASPDSSHHDSSSDSSAGRRKRKSPDSASPANLYPYENTQQWRADNVMDVDSKPQRSMLESPLLTTNANRSFDMDPNMQFISTEMQNHLDFKSARSSPKGFAISPSMTTMPSREIPRSAAEMNMPLTANNSIFLFGTESRDNSPPTPMAQFNNQQGSPSTLPGGYNFLPDQTWNEMQQGFLVNPSMISAGSSLQPNAAQVKTIPPGTMTAVSMPLPHHKVMLHVYPIPEKSRVETQINIKFTFDPPLPGVTRLHLPTHTIAKAKLLAKDVTPNPDTIELSAMLVCTTAMENAANKARALRVASGEEVLTPSKGLRRSSNGSKKEHDVPVDPNDPNLPQNGGEVRICDNCINRERKRAARKKVKNKDEDDVWASYEKQRVIVFNTTEYQTFHSPTPAKMEQLLKTGVVPPDAYVEQFSSEATQVDAPMRIACYCRHMNEKLGFQVIFTFKDWQGHQIAQVITPSIHITDDHKAHEPKHHEASQSTSDIPLLQQATIGSRAGAIGGFMQDTTAMYQPNLPHRQYHSSTDLVSFGRNMHAPTPYGLPPQSVTSAASSYRTLSRPASPTAQSGPKKKRKGSSSGPRVPTGLMMTRADQPQTITMPDMPASLITSGQAFSPDQYNDSAFATSQTSIPGAYGTNPSTPNNNLGNLLQSAHRSGSTENLPYFYSQPNSAHPSRAPSPTSFARSQYNVNAYNAQQALSTPTAAAFSNLTNMPPRSMESHRSQPTILKLTPSEGPMMGGIDVVVLGANFHRELEVKFGDNVATTTTFWNDKTLVCLLPPSALSGPVNVTLSTSSPTSQSPPPVATPIFFNYIDETEGKLLESALGVLAMRYGVSANDPRAFAKSVIDQAMNNTNGFGGGNGYGHSGAGGNVLSAGDKEGLFLAILDQIDMDDIPHPPNFDLKTRDGQTMLSLACALGYHRLVSGLLARGADPDSSDFSGFTPLMVAAMRQHPQIVRRLILKGADFTRRNIRGLTASDLSTSEAVSVELRHISLHVRSVSNGTNAFRSRANSEGSTRSLWGPPSPAASSSNFTTEDESAIEETDDELPPHQVASRRESGVKSVVVLDDEALMEHFRRTSGTNRRPISVSPLPTAVVPPTVPAGTSPSAFLAAWRENLAAQIQLFQQSAALSLQNFQIPTLPPMMGANLQDSSNLTGWRRLSSLVPQRRGRPWGSASVITTSDREGSEQETLRSDSTVLPPPAYSEIFPENADMPLDAKPPELLTEEPSVMVEAQAQSSSSSAVQPPAANSVRLQRRPRKTLLRIGKHTSEEQVKEIRQLRKESFTSARDDRNLWYIWFPLLLSLLIWWCFGRSLPRFSPMLEKALHTARTTVPTIWRQPAPAGEVAF